MGIWGKYGEQGAGNCPRQTDACMCHSLCLAVGLPLFSLLTRHHSPRQARHDIEARSESATANTGNESVCRENRSGRGRWVEPRWPNKTNRGPHRTPRRNLTGSGRGGRAVMSRRLGIPAGPVPVRLPWDAPLANPSLFHPRSSPRTWQRYFVPEDLRRSRRCQGGCRRAKFGQCNLYITWVGYLFSHLSPVRHCTVQ